MRFSIRYVSGGDVVERIRRILSDAYPATEFEVTEHLGLPYSTVSIVWVGGPSSGKVFSLARTWGYVHLRPGGQVAGIAGDLSLSPDGPYLPLAAVFLAVGRIDMPREEGAALAV